jgi:hypothetical protein
MTIITKLDKPKPIRQLKSLVRKGILDPHTLAPGPNAIHIGIAVENVRRTTINQLYTREDTTAWSATAKPAMMKQQQASNATQIGTLSRSGRTKISAAVRKPSVEVNMPKNVF